MEEEDLPDRRGRDRNVRLAERMVVGCCGYVAAL